MKKQSFTAVEEWNALKAKFNYCCAQCGRREGHSSVNEYGVREFAREDRSSELVRDHIRPRSKGGSDSIENIQPLCRYCNGVKGSKWPWPPPSQSLIACHLFCNE